MCSMFENLRGFTDFRAMADTNGRYDAEGIQLRGDTTKSIDYVD